MNEKLKNKIFVMISILCIVVILLPIWTGIGVVVYGFKEETLCDARGNPHVETVPEAGDVVTVPDEVEQTGGDLASPSGLGMSTTHSDARRAKVAQIWEEQGRTADTNKYNWCYIEVAGVNRYFVALAPLYGQAGDYVDVYITNDGVETLYPCIIVDSKDVWGAFKNEYPYVYNGVKYGHLNNDNQRCKIMEAVLEPYSEPPGFADSLAGVTRIQNGGNILDHPDGPVGLDGSYGSNSALKGEFASILGSMGTFFRDIWVSLCTLFDNLTNRKR